MRSQNAHSGPNDPYHGTTPGPSTGQSVRAWRVSGGPRVPSDDAQPPRRGDESVPAPTCAQPRGLVSLGPDALARSKLLDRPIFLSIGYAACHWCHVMSANRGPRDCGIPQRSLRRGQGLLRGAAGSRPGLYGRGPGDDRRWRLADVRVPDTGRAALLRRHVLAQREPRQGMPSFVQVLEGVDRAWREQRGEIEGAGQRLVEALVAQNRVAAVAAAPTPAMLSAATAGIEASFDARNGGWGSAPKFPQPMTIEFLLRRFVATSDARPLAIARRSLDAMADGGVRDQLGGGFHRYFDRRRMAGAALRADALRQRPAGGSTSTPGLTGDARYRAVGETTLDYVIRELTTSDGAFAASQDADTEGEEGATFVWTADEIGEVLGNDAPFFAEHYEVTPLGNWEGKTILRRTSPPAAADVEARLADARGRLLERRAGRPQPARDDKALAAWNGLAIAAFADAEPRAGRSSVPRGCGWRRRDRRRWTARGRRPARPLMEGWPAVGQGVPQEHHAPRRRPARTLRGHVRRALVHDRAGPHGPGAGAFRGPGRRSLRYRGRPRATRHPDQGPAGQRHAVRQRRGGARAAAPRRGGPARAATGPRPNGRSRTVAPFAERYPTAFAQWLSAIDFALSDAVEVAIVGNPRDAATRALLDRL